MGFNGFRIGDRVRMRSDMGPLKAGSVGLVVEEYEPLGPRVLSAEKAAEGDFEVVVVWPSLRHDEPAEAGPWLPDGLDVSNMHEGDAVAMRSRQLDFVDNLLVGG